jgi:hypothetical protein
MITQSITSPTPVLYTIPHPKYWLAAVPVACDLCNARIEDQFFNARIRTGGWATTCPDCHRRYGVGLGLGRGQRYTQVASGWLKTGG